MSGNDGMQIRHSKMSMTSYGFSDFFLQFIAGVQGVMLFFFYEAEIGLESWLAGLGFTIFAIWDALNDPIVGFLTDRPTRFTKKFGRRFPWIFASFVPMIFSFLLIFCPPNVNPQEQPFVIFGWLVFSTCLFDTFESIFTINIFALFPDKFRDRSERITASGIRVYVGFFGILAGFLIPPLIIIYGEIGTYALMAWVCVIISFISWILLLPGTRDDKATVLQYLEKRETQEKESFMKSLIEAFKMKNFIAFLIFYMLYQALTTTMTSSFLYLTRYILKAEAGVSTIIMAMFLLGGVIGIPIWIKFTGKKPDHRRTLLISGGVMAVAALILTFITNLIGIIILMLIFGIGLGGLWIMLSPAFGDVIDESVINYGKRQEGIYSGFRFFMGNLARVLQAVTFAVVHSFTGFIEGSEYQPSLALIGIQLHTGLIPAIFMIIGMLILWKFYDITPEKADLIKHKLVELKL